VKLALVIIEDEVPRQLVLDERDLAIIGMYEQEDDNG